MALRRVGFGLLALVFSAACGKTGSEPAAGDSAGEASPTGGRAAGGATAASGAGTGAGAGTGGASTGGALGGASTGGASTGGASTGGASTGGASTGGAEVRAGAGGEPMGGQAGTATTGGHAAGGARPAGGSAGAAGDAGIPSGGHSAGGAGGASGVAGSVGCDFSQLGDCVTAVTQIRPPAVNMLLVIDKSPSMEHAFGDTDRWNALGQALSDAVAATQGGVDYGLILYPSAESCAVADEVQLPVGASPAAITGALAANPPDVAGTPMAAALEVALDYYTTGAGASVTGPKYVLLVTDGGPNCNEALMCDIAECALNLEGSCPIAPENCCEFDPVSCVDHAATTARISALASAGIDTFVVGLPGSEPYAGYLGEFAAAGGRSPSGTGSYYTVPAGASLAELTSVLTEIGRQVTAACSFIADPAPGNPDLVNVALDCELAPQGDDGWSFNDDYTELVLGGQSCEALRTGSVQTVRVIRGCPTVQ